MDPQDTTVDNGGSAALSDPSFWTGLTNALETGAAVAQRIYAQNIAANQPIQVLPGGQIVNTSTGQILSGGTSTSTVVIVIALIAAVIFALKR